MTAYKALTGISYTDAKGEERRVEAGEVVKDLPKKSIAWLLKSECIEKDST